jgi:hypothetical protein
MAVRVRVRLTPIAGRPARPAQAVAVANSGYEGGSPGAILPERLAARLGLWPPPAGARVARFESPGGAFEMTAIPGALRCALAESRGVAVLAEAVVSRRETEVVMNDALVEALGIELVAVHRGIYRVGPRGKMRRSPKPRHW